VRCRQREDSNLTTSLARAGRGARNPRKGRLLLAACGALTLLAVLPACALMGSSGPPGPLFHYYDVDATGADLMAAVTRASPVRENGKIFHAYARWTVGWRLGWARDAAGLCRVASAQVTLASTITLPRLVAGDALQGRRFDRYLTALTSHELGHYRHGEEAAAEVRSALQALGPMENCGALDRAAAATAAAIVERYRQRDREYDRLTEHGRTQGASLES
jgi:predicted secreted Zn-dependent protease